MSKMADLWYWDDRTNTLESKIHNTTKKSRIVRSLCNKYLQDITCTPEERREKLEKEKFEKRQNLDSTKFLKDANQTAKLAKNARNMTNSAGQAANPSSLKPKESLLNNVPVVKASNFDYAQAAKIHALFKRTVQAAGKISELSKGIVSEDRSREWSLESVKNLAMEEMFDNFKSGKILCFSNQLQKKANMFGPPKNILQDIHQKHINQEKAAQKHNYRNITISPHLQNYPTIPEDFSISDPPHMISRTKPRKIKARDYMELLKQYTELEEFNTFALALVNFFSVQFELNKFEVENQKEKSGKSPKDNKLNEIKAEDLTLKKKSFEHQLGMSYASLLLGDNEIKDG